MIIQKPSKNLGKDLKSPDSNVVPVQVRPRAPIKINDLQDFDYLRSNSKNSDSRRIVDESPSDARCRLMVEYSKLSSDQQLLLVKNIILQINSGR